MSTSLHSSYVLESAVVPADLDCVWDLIKSMSFKFSKQVAQAQREEGDDSVLGQFTVAYTDNTVQTLRVVELSERRPTKRSIGMEMVTSDPPLAYASRMDHILLSAVTHGPSPSVYVEFSSEFS
eukprot:TRINITY_DN44637_c0_g1_i1.p1 TRINITY_DN44637_c0_g1~~TRINITY_DN44637_c0_g1_i1.p1  ORF type:complete len:124 (-),score=27.34 TRINITY_DN44637_c0_g1_i1:85-456(-)